MLEEGSRLARAGGDDAVLAAALARLGNLYVWPLEDDAAARAAYAESIGIYQRLGDVIPVEGILIGLGSLAERRGRFAEARAAYEQVVTQGAMTGGSNNTVAAYASLGLLALQENAIDQAAVCLSAGLPLGQRLASLQLASDCLAGLGVVAQRRGRSEQAARLGGTAEAQRLPLSSARSRIHPAHRTLQHAAWNAARTALGAERFAAMWAEGQALELDAAVALGLGDEDSHA